MKDQRSKIKDQSVVKSLKIKALAFTLSFALYTLHFALPAGAQGVSLAIDPPLITIDANPPARVKTPIIVENKGEETVVLEVQIQPFTAGMQGDGRLRYLTQDEIKALANPGIFEAIELRDKNTSVNELILGPKQQKQLDLIISLPKNEPAADYYFSLVFVGMSDQDLRPEEGQNLSVTSGGIATNVLLSVGPKDRSSAVLQEFSAPRFLPSGPVPFLIRLRNTGRHLIAPRGEIRIQNMFGQTIGKVPLLPVNILSGTSRYIPDSKQTAVKEIHEKEQKKQNEEEEFLPAAVWEERFLLGFYRAEVSLSLSDNGPVITREIMFYSFPVTAFVVLIIFVATFLVIRNRVKKRMK